jgi:hypothetical protein
MADVLARTEANATELVRSRRDMTKALHKFSHVLGVSLAMLPAEPSILRERIARASPKRVGMEERHWDNVRSLTLRALRHAGVRVLPGRARAGLSPGWEGLSSCLADPEHRFDLSRALRFFSAEGMEPEQVNSSAFAAFHDALQSNERPRQAVGDLSDGLPRLEPRRRRGAELAEGGPLRCRAPAVATPWRGMSFRPRSSRTATAS